MIERLSAIQFDKKAGSVRTEPGFVVAQSLANDDIEVIVKLSSKCDRGPTSLAIELLCACLAGDLRLPIPQPYVVDFAAEWIDSIVDQDWAAAARQSIPVAFGSKRVPAGFGPWIADTRIIPALTATAASVLLFDAVTDNPDRRSANPNCLQRGDEIRIIDHELCFGPMIIGWQAPWKIGALQHMATNGIHIFRDALRGVDVNWAPIVETWRLLSDNMIAGYESAIPDEWSAALPAVRKAIGKIIDARDHIAECANEVQRVLKC